jgi:hypothetical protein
MSIIEEQLMEGDIPIRQGLHFLPCTGGKTKCWLLVRLQSIGRVGQVDEYAAVSQHLQKNEHDDLLAQLAAE